MPPVPLRALPCVPQLGLGGGSGGLHPQAGLQGKLGFPSKGCSPVGQGWGAQGPWLSLGWWLSATEAQSSDSRGAVTPLSLWGWGWFGRVQPFSLQPLELLCCWGEAGPAPPPCPACHSLRSLDSMIVRLCAPSLLRGAAAVFVLCRTSKLGEPSKCHLLPLWAAGRGHRAPPVPPLSPCPAAGLGCPL